MHWKLGRVIIGPSGSRTLASEVSVNSQGLTVPLSLKTYSCLSTLSQSLVPQVVAPGRAEAISLDMTRSIPEEWEGRKVWMHTPFKGGVHATKEEMAL